MSQERVFLHDISSPLTSIQLNLENAMEMLSEGTPEGMAESLKLLRSCSSQAKKMAEMIHLRRGILAEGPK